MLDAGQKRPAGGSRVMWSKPFLRSGNRRRRVGGSADREDRQRHAFNPASGRGQRLKRSAGRSTAHSLAAVTERADRASPAWTPARWSSSAAAPAMSISDSPPKLAPNPPIRDASTWPANCARTAGWSIRASRASDSDERTHRLHRDERLDVDHGVDEVAETIELDVGEALVAVKRGDDNIAPARENPDGVDVVTGNRAARSTRARTAGPDSAQPHRRIPAIRLPDCMCGMTSPVGNA